MLLFFNIKSPFSCVLQAPRIFTRRAERNFTRFSGVLSLLFRREYPLLNAFASLLFCKINVVRAKLHCVLKTFMSALENDGKMFKFTTVSQIGQCKVAKLTSTLKTSRQTESSNTYVATTCVSSACCALTECTRWSIAEKGRLKNYELASNCVVDLRFRCARALRETRPELHVEIIKIGKFLLDARVMCRENDRVRTFSPLAAINIPAGRNCRLRRCVRVFPRVYISPLRIKAVKDRNADLIPRDVHATPTRLRTPREK